MARRAWFARPTIRPPADIRTIAKRFIVAMLLPLAACQEAKPLASSDQPDKLKFYEMDRMEMRGDQGIFTADRDGKVTTIAFDVPVAQVDPNIAHFGFPVGETDEKVVVYLDQYASRAPAGPCSMGKGVESFVRVFSLPLRRQLLVVPAGSCVKGTPGPNSPATWLGNGRFRIEGTGAVYAVRGSDAVQQEAR